ncbi:MAG TPA: histidine kinase [Dehalococcoidia bacterium]|jgi:signal transduction histidine kinase|nr:histidine kinase [Dehalococcoidia bacterium]
MNTQFSNQIDGDRTGNPQADLMDRMIQGLYGLGLKLEYCIALVDESPEQARAGLDAAITDLGEVIDVMRHHMQSLRGLT